MLFNFVILVYRFEHRCRSSIETFPKMPEHPHEFSVSYNEFRIRKFLKQTPIGLSFLLLYISFVSRAMSDFDPFLGLPTYIDYL